jgi:glutathione S-transferase
MRIYHTFTSPYARIARIAAHSCGTAIEAVAIESNQLRTDTNPVLAVNPTGRVPTLVDGDVVLSETPAICRYIESKGDGTRIFAPAGDWSGIKLESWATSLLDGASLWTRELRRPAEQQSDWLCGVERSRAVRSLDWFDAEPGIRSGQAPWDYAHFVLAIGVEYFEFRKLIPDWRQGRDAIAAWFAEQQKRPSWQACALPPGA